MSSADQITTEVLEAWKSSICSVLGQLTGAPVRATVAQTADPTAHNLRFAAGKDFTGNISFALTSADAIRLTQILLAEPLTSPAEWDTDREETLAELMRQFAGQAETAVKAALEREIGFRLTNETTAASNPAAQQIWIFEGDQLPKTFLSISSSVDVQQKIEAATDLQTLTAQSAPPPANLDILVDVELDVTMRFGQRRMMLRDVLHLNQGSVVELDCDLQDPAELVVGGRVVARGDVVIVDGNYGLRITEVLSAPTVTAFPTA